MANLLFRVFLASFLLVSAAFGAPEKWKSAIDAFLVADAAHPPQHDAIVFVGSSSIVKWKSLSSDFPNFPVINRGFGGSELADSVEYADEIVIPYHPRAVVLYAGDNDLADGKKPEEILADFRAFREKVHTGVPSAHIFYLSIKFSPSRATLQGAMQRTNDLIAADCATTNYSTFVDVNTPMLDSRDQPRPELFEPDQLHMKATSYGLWVKTLAPLLQR